MKFQIECNTGIISQVCLICQESFQMHEARLIVYNDQGDTYGDICHHCIVRGGDWIKFQLQQFSNKLLTLK